jgi:DNA (cytosine-5)-methyltransferase 1
MSGYNYIDLFHGIGGFALGAYWAGMKFENHFCSDIEPYAQKLYKLRFPESIQLGDITKINTEDLKKYGNKWIITGGFPCQDISCAGKGLGLSGKRSGLWFEYWRIIRDLRPEFAIMENVGMLTIRGLDAVLGSLHEIGYNAVWQTIRACQLGMPHARERVWIIAYPEQVGWGSIEQDIFKKKRDMGKYILFDGLCNGESIEFKGDREKAGRQLDIKSSIHRKDDGVSGRVDRVKGTGNAIVPQIAELLFNQIKVLVANEPRKAS